MYHVTRFLTIIVISQCKWVIILYKIAQVLATVCFVRFKLFYALSSTMTNLSTFFQVNCCDSCSAHALDQLNLKSVTLSSTIVAERNWTECIDTSYALSVSRGSRDPLRVSSRFRLGHLGQSLGLEAQGLRSRLGLGLGGGSREHPS